MAKSKKRDEPAKQGGGNMMLFGLIGGGVAILGLCLCCGGIGGGGYFMGWFGGGGEKKEVAKGKDKDRDNNPDKGGGDPGPPKGTGPLVTDENFSRASRDGKPLAEVEQIMGPGLPLKGADADNAKKYQGYQFLAQGPNVKVYQWWNSQAVYFISFWDNNTVAGRAREQISNVKDTGGPGPGKGAVTQANFKKVRQNMTLAEVEQILGPGQRLQGATLQNATQNFPKSLGTLRDFEKFIPNAQYYQWTNGKEYYFMLMNNGRVSGSVGPSLKGRD
jgi:hypothetical protein